jgi:hypothetical protein
LNKQPYKTQLKNKMKKNEKDAMDKPGKYIPLKDVLQQ